MYDTQVLTGVEEIMFFSAAMEALEKETDEKMALVTSSSSSGSHLIEDAPHQAPSTDHKIFTEDEVKSSCLFNTSKDDNDDEPNKVFFIAGRGGETNFHAGNSIFRDRVLEHTQEYVEAGPKGRGKKFARDLLQRQGIARNVYFVVRQSYFCKNCTSGKISDARKNSVLKEHAPRTLHDLLTNEPGNHYLTIGEDWVIGIITDLLRTAAAKCKPQAKKTPSYSCRSSSAGSKRAFPFSEISVPSTTRQTSVVVRDDESLSDDDDDSSHSSGSEGSASDAMFLSMTALPPAKRAKTFQSSAPQSSSTSSFMPPPPPALERARTSQVWVDDLVASLDLQQWEQQQQNQQLSQSLYPLELEEEAAALIFDVDEEELVL